MTDYRYHGDTLLMMMMTVAHSLTCIVHCTGKGTKMERDILSAF